MGPVDSFEQIGLGVDPRSCDTRCASESGDGDRVVACLQLGERSSARSRASALRRCAADRRWAVLSALTRMPADRYRVYSRGW